jgi:hypothetical protein
MSGSASTWREAFTILEQAAKETRVSLREVEYELWRELAERRILWVPNERLHPTAA